MRDGVISHVSENVHPKFLGGVEQMFDEHIFGRWLETTQQIL